MWVDWVVGRDECYIPHLSSNLTFSLQVIILYFIFKPNPTYSETMCGFTFTFFLFYFFFGGLLLPFIFFKDKVLFFRETLCFYFFLHFFFNSLFWGGVTFTLFFIFLRTKSYFFGKPKNSGKPEWWLKA